MTPFVARCLIVVEDDDDDDDVVYVLTLFSVAFRELEPVDPNLCVAFGSHKFVFRGTRLRKGGRRADNDDVTCGGRQRTDLLLVEMGAFSCTILCCVSSVCVFDVFCYCCCCCC